MHLFTLVLNSNSYSLPIVFWHSAVVQYIDEKLAQCLSQHNGRTLYLDNLHHIDLEVLQILIRHGGRGLSLGGIKNISLQEASVLATYRGNSVG